MKLVRFTATTLFVVLSLAVFTSVFAQRPGGGPPGAGPGRPGGGPGGGQPGGPPPPGADGPPPREQRYPGPMGPQADFLSSEMRFGDRLVKGSPYSAQFSTENTQTLADGTRITRKSNGAVYRSGDGRTRREQALGALGPVPIEGEPRQMVFINDPVAGAHYVLDVQERSARKMPFRDGPPPPAGQPLPAGPPPSAGPPPPAGQPLPAGPLPSAGPPPPAGQPLPAEPLPSAGPPPPAGQPPPVGPPPSAGPPPLQRQPDEVTTESLGKQTIEGVEAEGTRSTITIPAGRIGNDRPLKIVSERWFSPELQIVVLSKHNDPFAGENVYRLTSISRNEPPLSLFMVPADYRVMEEHPPQPPQRRPRQ